MVQPGEVESWQFFPADSFISITYEEELIGFCKPDFAARIVTVLNDDERLRKALRLACYDLAALTGGGTEAVAMLEQKYLSRTAKPKSGTAAIALLLRDRQDQLGVNEKEFLRFCDSYRLSLDKINAIYAGEEIDETLLLPLSRILGRSVEDLLQILEGSLEV